MDRLPDEIILQVLSYLDIPDIVSSQHLSRRYLLLGRDTAIWKQLCFANSRAEAQRKRQLLSPVNDAKLVALRDAVSSLAGGDAAQPATSDSSRSEAHMRMRAYANWDPSFPHEQIDYYQEYIHRHAPIAPLGWLSVPSNAITQSKHPHEVTGIGTLRGEDNSVEKVIAPLDDGSICVWDMSDKTENRKGRLVGRSVRGLLAGYAAEPDRAKAVSESKAVMTEVGAVECVSIDSVRKRGLFAVQNDLHEVDLHTLQTISKETFPFAITALSDADSDYTAPVTIGTASTVHLYDPRNKSAVSRPDSTVRTELIGGPTASHVVLSQAGPLSILHHSSDHPDAHSIWVAGRFTHLLNYDRRFFPRLRGTVHSGARISSLTLLPYPHIPRSLDLLQNPTISLSEYTTTKSRAGTSLLAAGVYKGKGSLELYGLSPSHTTLTSTSSINRQTASASKLLSCASHGASLVFSDGDGNIKWTERNGWSPIRTFNINEPVEPPSFNQLQSYAQDGTADGIFSSSASEMPGTGDIVQKLIPTCPGSTSVLSSSSNSNAESSSKSNDLLLWTGDGRIGLFGFGYSDPIRNEEIVEKAKSAEERALEDAERQYAGTLRRALEGQADEARFMRGLGLA
ncbi:hypothetical protein MBLNU457_g0163t1 [Dothideomycetes sp. NU457]